MISGAGYIISRLRSSLCSRVDSFPGNLPCLSLPERNRSSHQFVRNALRIDSEGSHLQPSLNERAKMPIYEYQCEICGNEFEKRQKFSDPVVDKCSTCGGKARRLISQSTFVLKGSGWYVTDYGKKASSSSGATPPKKECSSETKASSSDAG
jgi:putative FmdB family regulatory protein